MNWPKKQNPKTVLGLTLDGSRLDAVVLHRTNGHAVAQKVATAALTLDLLNNEAELVGREIRNQLDAAGVKERRCIVGVPLKWTIAVHTKIPEMPEEDVESFLQIEAERSFPCNMDELQVAVARHKSPGGEQFATHIGVRRDHLARLEAVLAAAQLKPVGFNLGIVALPGAVVAGAGGSISLAVSEASVDVLIASGGGVVALRTLENAFESEGGEKRVLTDVVARELRITLGQLPMDIVDNVRRLTVFGAGRYAQQLAQEIQPRAKAMGLSVESVTAGGSEQHGLKFDIESGVSAALSLAAQQLGGRAVAFEFLPPKPSVWQQFSGRYSAKRLGYAGAAAAAVVVIFGGMFLFQQIQLSSLRSDWAKMKTPVADLDKLQAQIRKYRPWTDESLANLSILRRVTEAFPEDGVVSAKTVEIRNSTQVNVTGTTRSFAALQKTTDQLRAAKDVGDVHTDTLRGTSPMQFTFNFQWGQSARTP
jgi:hypothetical protein